MDADPMSSYRYVLSRVQESDKAIEFWNDNGADLQHLQYMCITIVRNVLQRAQQLYYSDFDNDMCLSELFSQ